jgi:Domain of unknown function (DUF4293)
MIQRIQSVFIALTVACVLAFLAFPIWTKADAATQQSISLDAFNIVSKKSTLSQITPVFYLAVLAIFAAAIGIFSLLQYKNRMRQVMMVALNSLVIGGLLGTSVYLVYSKTSQVFLAEVKGDFGIGLYLLFAALVFNWLANTFIRKDERMVKDADRMR